MKNFLYLLIISQTIEFKTFVLVEKLNSVEKANIFVLYKIQESEDPEITSKFRITSFRFMIATELEPNFVETPQESTNLNNTTHIVSSQQELISRRGEDDNASTDQTTFNFQSSKFKIYNYLSQQIDTADVSIFVNSHRQDNDGHDSGIFKITPSFLILRINEISYISPHKMFSASDIESSNNIEIFNLDNISTEDIVSTKNNNTISLYPKSDITSRKSSSDPTQYYVFTEWDNHSLSQLKDSNTQSKPNIFRRLMNIVAFKELESNNKEKNKHLSIPLNNLNEPMSNFIALFIRNSPKINTNSIYPTKELEELSKELDEPNDEIYKPLNRENFQNIQEDIRTQKSIENVESTRDLDGDGNTDTLIQKEEEENTIQSTNSNPNITSTTNDTMDSNEINNKSDNKCENISDIKSDNKSDNKGVLQNKQQNKRSQQDRDRTLFYILGAVIALLIIGTITAIILNSKRTQE